MVFGMGKKGGGDEDWLWLKETEETDQKQHAILDWLLGSKILKEAVMRHLGNVNMVPC